MGSQRVRHDSVTKPPSPPSMKIEAYLRNLGGAGGSGGGKEFSSRDCLHKK